MMFHVSRFPGPPQFSCRELPEAVEVARRVATRVGSQLLFTRDGVRFEKL
jgi:hypothetical protein